MVLDLARTGINKSRTKSPAEWLGLPRIPEAYCHPWASVGLRSADLWGHSHRASKQKAHKPLERYSLSIVGVTPQRTEIRWGWTEIR